MSETKSFGRVELKAGVMTIVAFNIAYSAGCMTYYIMLYGKLNDRLNVEGDKDRKQVKMTMEYVQRHLMKLTAMFICQFGLLWAVFIEMPKAMVIFTCLSMVFWILLFSGGASEDSNSGYYTTLAIELVIILVGIYFVHLVDKYSRELDLIFNN